jgi:multisubunit Na+/H+ antiporter MnhG subunit
VRTAGTAGGDAARQALATARTRWDRVLAALERLGLDENAILLAFGAVVGLAAALGVVLFYRAIDASYYLFFRWPQEALRREALFAVFGYVTASIASLFVARDAETDDGELAGAAQLAALRADVATLSARVEALLAARERP